MIGGSYTTVTEMPEAGNSYSVVREIPPGHRKRDAETPDISIKKDR